MEFLQPKDWARAKRYANGVVADGRLIVLGGQIGWNNDQEFESDEFIPQFRQTLENIVTLLAEAGAGPENLVRLTWFITDRDANLNSQSAMGEVYRDIMGRNYAALSVVQVVKLIESRALVDIEATAVMPL